MNKYFGIFKTSIKQEQKLMGNTLLAMFSFCVIIVIFNQLWKYIYSNNIGGIINGYSLDMMLWYLIMAETLTYCLNSKGVTKSFAGEIKTGKIAYSLNKPYNYYFYQIVTTIGYSVWKMLFLIPTALIIGFILLGGASTFNFWHLIPFIFSIFLSCLLSTFIYGIIGLLAFWIEEPTPFTWIVQKFVLLLGLFFPPEFFPSWLQTVINYSPIYAMMSGPCKLFADFSWELFSKVLLSQAVYLFIFCIIGFVIYNFGIKKVNINGG